MKRRCYCGKTSKNGKCSDGESLFSCGKACGKPLKNCRHGCRKVCHAGACEEKCEEEVVVKCKCGKQVEKEVCWKVQAMAGYNAKMPVQVVLACNEACGVMARSVSMTATTTTSMTTTEKGRYFGVVVVILAMLIAVWFGYSHSGVCKKQDHKVQSSSTRSGGIRSGCVRIIIRVIFIRGFMIRIIGISGSGVVIFMLPSRARLSQFVPQPPISKGVLFVRRKRRNKHRSKQAGDR